MSNFIACVRWGDQSVRSVQMTCGTCDCAVALDYKNESLVKAMNLRPMCWDCLKKLQVDFEYGGSLVAGREYKDFNEATAAAMKERADWQSRN